MSDRMECESAESHRRVRDQRGWSGVRGLESVDRVAAFLSGMHERMGKMSLLRVIDDDIARYICGVAEERSSDYIETKPPSPGCSLYGFMFDIKATGKTGVLITALQVFSSESAGAAYDVFAAKGSWRNKDARHSPWARKKVGGCWHHVAERVPASRHETAPLDTPYQPVWINLQIPICVQPGGVVSLYIHSADAWGAVAYRMLDDTGCQATPGMETHRHKNVSLMTGTFTESSEPFEDVDGFVCAFAGAVEYDILESGTFPGAWESLEVESETSAYCCTPTCDFVS